MCLPRLCRDTQIPISPSGTLDVPACSPPLQIRVLGATPAIVSDSKFLSELFASTTAGEESLFHPELTSIARATGIVAPASAKSNAMGRYKLLVRFHEPLRRG